MVGDLIKNAGDWALDARMLVIDRDGNPILNILVPLHPVRSDEFFFENCIGLMTDIAQSVQSEGQNFNPTTIMSVEEMLRQREEIASDLYYMLSVLLYIISITSQEQGEDDDFPRVPEPTMTKRGPRHFPPNAPKLWEVSYQLGAEISLAKSNQGHTGSQDTGRTLLPHIRSAHWHKFRKGSKPDEGSLLAHWIPPIVVGAEGSKDTGPLSDR